MYWAMSFGRSEFGIWPSCVRSLCTEWFRISCNKFKADKRYSYYRICNSKKKLYSICNHMKLNDVLWPRVVKISSYEVLSNHFIFYVDFLGRSKNRVHTKVSFFHQCSKMQIIPIKKFIIQTCFFQFLWFFRLKCWLKVR